jgi:N-acetylglucosaminyl-diphospho-decaprenol L-rhamnosyltransferase
VAGARPRGPDCAVAPVKLQAPASDVSVVVVTFNAMPYIDRCLASVRGYETVVVDHGSTDGTLELVREQHPDVRLVEQENLGLAAGWNRGMREVGGRWFFILNADAWIEDGALERLVEFAESRERAALVGPRLRYPDGRLQRSVRGFPTLWRLATEYLFLRKLGPRTRLFNAFYANGFDHETEREADFVMGAAMLVRREAVDAVGPLDEGYFLFSEETDWCYRCHQAGWKVIFWPGAEVTHVLGAGHGGRLFREQVRGHVRFMTKHHGMRTGERTRRLLRVSLLLRGAIYRGERGRAYRNAAHWLGSGSAAELGGVEA